MTRREFNVLDLWGKEKPIPLHISDKGALSGDSTNRLLAETHPGPQTALLYLILWAEKHNVNLEVLLGGARGGGKTFAGQFVGGFRCLNNREHEALVLRYEAKDLDEWKRKFLDIFGPFGAVTRGDKNTIYFPNQNSTLTIGHFTNQASFEARKGGNINTLIVEELTQTKDYDLYEKLISTVRGKTGKNTLILGTTNPDGPGHQWVKGRWITQTYPDGTPIRPGDLFYDSTTINTDTMKGRALCFIPAKLTDNPTNDPSYLANMAALQYSNPLLYEQWVLGSWDALEGLAFNYQSGTHKLAVNSPDSILPGWWHREIGMDWGFDHQTAAYWGCKNQDSGRVHVYREYVTRMKSPDQVGSEIAILSKPDLMDLPDHRMTLHLSPDCFKRTDNNKTQAEQLNWGMQTVLGPTSAFVIGYNADEWAIKQKDEERAAGLLHRRIAEQLRDANIVIRAAINDRKGGWSLLRRYLRNEEVLDVARPSEEHIAALARRGDAGYALREYLKFFEGQEILPLPGIYLHHGCQWLDQCLSVLQPDPEDPEDILPILYNHKIGTVGDDPADALRYLLMGMTKSNASKPKEVWMAEQLADNAINASPGDPDYYNRLHHKTQWAEQQWSEANDSPAPIRLPRGTLYS